LLLDFADPVAKIARQAVTVVSRAPASITGRRGTSSGTSYVARIEVMSEKGFNGEKEKRTSDGDGSSLSIL
jgi:hypothetical protein